MAKPGEVSPVSVAAMRERDPKTNGEVLPERQTLNDKRVLEFLHGKVVLANFDNLFDLEMGIQLTGSGSTPTEQMISGKLLDAKTILGKCSKVDLMKEKDPAVVAGVLDNLKTPPTNMPTQEAERVLNSWQYFDSIRLHCKKLLNAEDVLSNARKAEYSTSQSITEGVQGALGTARENWDTLSTSQKLLFAGVALVGGVFLLKSKNAFTDGIKSVLKYGAMIGGGGWLLNKAWYLFTGESAVDAITGTTQGGHKSPTFLKDAFRTDKKGAEVMTESFVQIGDLSFMDLLEKYEQNQSTKTIEGTRMSPQNAFIAMDIVVKRFGMDALKKRYGKYNPPIMYSQVVVSEMAQDPNIKLKDALTDRVAEGTGDYFQRAYHYMASTGPAVWLGKKYEDWFGKEATPEELEKFAKRFGEVVQNDAEVPAAIENRLLPSDKTAASNYVKVLSAGKAAPRYGLKYRAESDGYLYMVVDRVMNNVNGDEKALNATIQQSIGQAEDFLVDHYKVDRAAAARNSEPHGSVFVLGTSTLKYLVRYKIK